MFAVCPYLFLLIICPLIFCVFTPHPLRVDILYVVFGVCLFFVSFINTPASCTITFLPCDTLLLTDSDCPSILESKKQASFQMCVFVCACTFFSHLLLHLSLVFDCWSNWNYTVSLCPTHLCILWLFFFLFYMYCFSHWFKNHQIQWWQILIFHGIICSLTLPQRSTILLPCTNCASVLDQ